VIKYSFFATTSKKNHLCSIPHQQVFHRPPSAIQPFQVTGEAACNKNAYDKKKLLAFGLELRENVLYLINQI